MEINEIIKAVSEEKVIPPGTLADYRLRLAGESGRILERLEEILKLKADQWLEIRQREEIQSDKMADRIWDATDLGKEEMSIRMTLKRFEKILSAINSRLRIYEYEAKHTL